MRLPCHFSTAVIPNRNRAILFKAFLTAAVTAAGGWLLLRCLPALPIAVFARGTAALAGWFAGGTVTRVESGWMLAGSMQTVVVTAACSATDYFLIVATLISWQSVRRGLVPVTAALTGLIAALPLTLGVNALRVVVIAQALPWIIPAFPEAYRHFLHLLAGAAIFLPALIILNLILETYGRSRIPLCR